MNLQKKADRAFQDTFVADHPYCEMCGALTSCGHHFVTKAACSALRYDSKNMVAVCVGCHLKFHSKFASIMNAQVVISRGKEWVDYLNVKRRESIKPSKKYYTRIIDEIKRC